MLVNLAADPAGSARNLFAGIAVLAALGILMVFPATRLGRPDAR